eukprot:6197607-Pleurochrysis_carterae.AAC.2
MALRWHGIAVAWRCGCEVVRWCGRVVVWSCGRVVVWSCGRVSGAAVLRTVDAPFYENVARAQRAMGRRSAMGSCCGDLRRWYGDR